MTSPTPLLIVRDPRFREHAGAPGHPERPARLEAIERRLEAEFPDLPELAVRAADDAEIASIHDRAYLEELGRQAGKRTQLDADTYLAPRSLEVARLAVGGAIDLARCVVRGGARTGFALVRPPGHHAERERAMGFCLFNQVAIVAEQLRAHEGLERIAIVDWDVHHGNGTQHQFETDRDTLFLSTHQFPFYPGTGSLHERGRAAGEGATVNLPVPAGCGDAEYRAIFADVVVPVLSEFRPEVMLVSAGFDAHAADPLAGMRLSTSGFAALAAMLRGAADELCGGRMVWLLEGGYDLAALADSVAAVAHVLAAGRPPEAPRPGPAGELSRRLLDAYREAHAGSWRCLRETRRG